MVNNMRDEYDIKSLNPRKNPYAKKMKQQVTMNMNTTTVEYFKSMSSESGIPYQTLINLYLDECVKEKKTIKFAFENEFINSFRMPMPFSDAFSFDDWAMTGIAFMRARSIIDGVGDNRFDAKGYLTKEQAVKIAVKMLAVIDNPDFAPSDAHIVDSINGNSLYSWLENGKTVVALYDTDGKLLKSFRTASLNEENNEQLC